MSTGFVVTDRCSQTVDGRINVLRSIYWSKPWGISFHGLRPVELIDQICLNLYNIVFLQISYTSKNESTKVSKSIPTQNNLHQNIAGVNR